MELTLAALCWPPAAVVFATAVALAALITANTMCLCWQLFFTLIASPSCCNLSPPPAGKTVEMLSLILVNPPPYNHKYILGVAAAEAAAPAGGGTASAMAADAAAAAAGGGRPGSAASSPPPPPPPRPRGGTLVVCPPTLLQQWQAELANHAHGTLAVEIYDGLRGLSGADDNNKPGRDAGDGDREVEVLEVLDGGSGRGRGSGRKRQKTSQQQQRQRELELYPLLLAGEYVAPTFDAEAEVAAAMRRLQKADVVLTSFDVLRAEVGHVWCVGLGGGGWGGCCDGGEPGIPL